MSPSSSESEPLGAVVYRLPLPVQTAKRFVLMIFGGLTLMVTVWAATMLTSSVFVLPDESRRLFVIILTVFALIIGVGFNLVWWFLRRYPRALVVHERALLLEHGSRSRTVKLEAVVGLEQRLEQGSSTFVVLLADGSEIPFGQGREADAAADALVSQAGLEWTKRPLQARRADR